MNIGQTTQAIVLASDQRWIGSTHGVDAAETCSLDTAAFATHAVVIEKAERPGTNGTVPSGTPLSRAANGLMVPAGTAGAAPAGYLVESVSLPLDETEAAVGALLWHGRV